MSILDSLHDIALAIWFLDGGGKAGRGRRNAYFNTAAYDDASKEVAIQYFNEIGVFCHLIGGKIFCTVDGTNTLVKIISPTVPLFMLPKLH